jgi:hypothetical protein
MKRILAFFGLFLGLAASSHALILAGGDGTQNATGVGAGAGWDYVGSVGGATGVYLGSYGGHQWVLTAHHVGMHNFTLGSTTYNAVAGSAIQVKNADETFTDLLLYRIDGNPGLANLSMASSPVAVNSSLVMIGAGRNREAASTTWNASWNEAPPPVYTGYKWVGTKTKRWGTNTLDAYETISLGGKTVTAFYTDFDNVSNQAQGAEGDSGGGVFYFDGSSWQLAGIMVGITLYPGQPTEASVFGARTYMADLSAYESWIMAAIPEPSTYALLLLGAAALGWMRLRRRG